MDDRDFDYDSQSYGVAAPRERHGSARAGRISPRSASEALQPERIPPPPPRSRAVRHPLVIFFNFLLTVAVVALLGAGGTLVYAKLQFEGEGPLEEARTFVVAKGSTLGTVAEALQRTGIITNRWIFSAGVRLNRETGGLKAGEYLIPPHASMREVMETMISGKSILLAVTLPEGLTSQQIVDRLMAEEGLVGNVETLPPEGSLLPDTYHFTRGETRQNIINRMRRERDRFLSDVWSRRVDGLPVSTQEEMVTLASIVEKETGIADERSRVAAVFINRLKQGMRLQSDPTVIYGLFGGKGKPADRPIYQSDLQAANPYNTYVIDGLPRGPIANPGRAALEAVANPSRTNDLYFVADGTGGHAFSETYEVHRRNVARLRQIEARRQQEAAAAAVGATEAIAANALGSEDALSGAAAFAEPEGGARVATASAGEEPAATREFRSDAAAGADLGEPDPSIEPVEDAAAAEAEAAGEGTEATPSRVVVVSGVEIPLPVDRPRVD